MRAMEIHPFDNIDTIADAVHANAKAKGFHPKRKSEAAFLNEQILNLIAEAVELQTAWRNGELRAPCDKADKMLAMGLPPLTCIEEEYADIIIRALDQCRRLGVDITAAIAVKHEFNKSRPHKHGGKKS